MAAAVALAAAEETSSVDRGLLVGAPSSQCTLNATARTHWNLQFLEICVCKQTQIRDGLQSLGDELVMSVAGVNGIGGKEGKEIPHVRKGEQGDVEESQGKGKGKCMGKASSRARRAAHLR